LIDAWQFIRAEGEKLASRAYREAANEVAKAPNSMHLRYLQTLRKISGINSETIVMPISFDLLRCVRDAAPRVLASQPEVHGSNLNVCLQNHAARPRTEASAVAAEWNGQLWRGQTALLKEQICRAAEAGAKIVPYLSGNVILRKLLFSCR